MRGEVQPNILVEGRRIRVGRALHKKYVSQTVTENEKYLVMRK